MRSEHNRFQLIFAAIIIIVISIAVNSQASELKSIRVAAVQTKSTSDSIDKNLKNAAKWAKSAADSGAKLILLPELMPSGYILSNLLWDFAEPFDGKTVAWLKELSVKHGLWIGTSFVEAYGDDFYNTFVLTDPRGRVAGRVRKRYPTGPESLLIKGFKGSHVIETELGKIGVAICFDSTQCEIIRSMYDESVDIVLLPHADPLMPKESRSNPDHNLLDTALVYANSLDVPVILANHGGAWKTPLPGFFPQIQSEFRGQSCIINSDGTVVKSLGNEEGMIVGDIIIRPFKKKDKNPPACYGRYCIKLSLLARASQALLAPVGTFLYKLSDERSQKADQISIKKIKQ
jgi:N-carbamoylputrescine amidase